MVVRKRYLSVRGKKFRGAHVYSIVKKKRGLRANDFRTSFFNTVRHSRVVRNSIQIEDGYSQYLCFNIITGSNSLIPQMEHSDHQQENHALVYDILK